MRAIDQFYSTIFAANNKSYREFANALGQANEQLSREKTYLAGLLIPAEKSVKISHLESKTSAAAIECLIAIARYRVSTGMQPRTLADAFSALGQSMTATDQFSQEPLRRHITG